MEVVIAYDNCEDENLPDGTRIIGTNARLGCIQSRIKDLIGLLFRPYDRLAPRIWKRRYKSALGLFQDTAHIAPILMRAYSISRHVKKLKPSFVFGMHAYYHGPAAAMCSKTKRVIMPFGDDIYNFAGTSPLAHAIMKWTFRRADLICPGAAEARVHIIDHFGVAPTKVLPLSHGVDLALFSPVSLEERRALRARYRLPAEAVILINSRRYRPPWGSDLVLDVFLTLAESRKDVHFVIVGGKGSDTAIQAAENAIGSLGLADRFTIFRDDVPLSTYAELHQASDIMLSLIKKRDMGSLGVLQGAFAGCAPILSQQPEYTALADVGFACLYANVNNREDVLEKITAYLASPDLRQEHANRNHDMILEKFERRTRMDAMLSSIRAHLKI